MTLRILRYLTLFVATIGLAQGQIRASLQLTKSIYLAGEPVVAQVTITNHAGRDLTFSGSTRMPWIDFMVRTRKGDQVIPFQETAFGTMTVPTGQTMGRQFVLSNFFPLTEPGNFSVSAVIRLPGQDRDGTVTNSAGFSLNPGSQIISPIKVGIPGKPSESREYRVMTFRSKETTQIYAQVLNGRTGLPISTFALADVLMLRKPQVTVDYNQRMHILFLHNPGLWIHCQINTNGELVGTDMHKNGAQGDPRLYTSPEGVVSIVNSRPFDPVAEAEARAKIHNASDRPTFTFD